MPTTQEYLEKVDNLIALRNLTPGTMRDYRAMCVKFLSWCDSIGVTPETITIVQVQMYILNLKNVVHYAPKTINSNISFIRFFFNYILSRHLDKYMLPYQRVDLNAPEVLSKAEVITFINASPNLKAKALITLLYSCGLRSAEVVSLKYSDISRERKTIYIQHTKNRSARYVPLSQTALDVLTSYWLHFGKPKDWLFPGTNPKEHIRKDTLYQYIKQIKEKLGWENRRITSHTFRHCLGTHMYEDGCDLPYIQKYLGHKSITSTTVYITVTGEKQYANPLDLMGGIKLE